MRYWDDVYQKLIKGEHDHHAKKHEDLYDNNGKLIRMPLEGLYEAPFDRLGAGGRWIRHKLLGGIVVGVPAIVKFQTLRRPWLDTLMQVLSFMGTEDFYTPIVVLLAIVIDSRLAYLNMVLMGMSFYLTTFLKNSLRLPRPPSPPVAVLENTYDWALPSLHALIGTALPWYLFIYIYQNYQMNALAALMLFVFVVIWSVSVAVSRVYLGVHSLADIISGIIPGVALLVTYLTVDDTFDMYMKEQPNVTFLVAFMFYVVGHSIHPGSGPPTHSHGETVSTASVALGMLYGRARTMGSERWFFTALLEQQEATHLTTTAVIALSLARLLIGTPLIFAIRSLVKVVVKEAVFKACYYLGVPAYSYSHYKKTAVQISKHLTENFRIPPVENKPKTENGVSNGTAAVNGVSNGSSPTHKNGFSHNSPTNGHSNLYSSSRLPFDVDIPTKAVTYTIMGWMASEWLHHLFYALSLTAHTS